MPITQEKMFIEKCAQAIQKMMNKPFAFLLEKKNTHKMPNVCAQSNKFSSIKRKMIQSSSINSKQFHKSFIILHSTKNSHFDIKSINKHSIEFHHMFSRDLHSSKQLTFRSLVIFFSGLGNQNYFYWHIGI